MELIKTKYKQTEVGLIPDDWKVFVLRSVLKWISDVDHYMPKTEKIGIPYVMTGDLKEKVDEKDFKNCKRISERDYEKLSKKVKNLKGDIILARYATVGSVSYVNIDFDFVVSYSCVTIRPDKYILLGLFLFYYFKSNIFKLEVNNNVKANIQDNVGIGDLYKMKIPLPPLPEQQAIAEVLSDTDNLIQALEKQIAKKRLIKQGVMQKLLTPKEGWELKSFGEIFEICGGFSATREQLSDEGYCYLHYGDIHGSEGTYIDCSADYSIIPKLKIGLNKISKKSLLKDGDVVFVDASEDDEGTSRHIVVRNENNIPFISGLHTIIARSKVESLNIKYKSFCFQCKYIKDQFKFYAVGTKVSGISKTSIKKIIIYSPPMSEQINIANTLEAMDIEIETIEKKLSKYKTLKQGLMQNLLTGKIRLTEKHETIQTNNAWRKKHLCRPML